ncbi:hypothetical protein [Halorussus halophilus]|uniref:hypothetical protein n=1 Tax=Halorussus halophilus TaxID=2650975 RepID=UPI00130170E1|nr:hypothetical protein [Halorussus halophilus]
MPDGCIEQMERIADHLGDGWVVETLAVASDGVGATARYAWTEECHVAIEWATGADGQQVTLETYHESPQTWLDTDETTTGLAADAIQDCAWYVEQELTAPTQVGRYGGSETGSDLGTFDDDPMSFDGRSTPRSARFSRV